MELERSSFPELAPLAKRVGPFVGAAVVAIAGIGYAVHEHGGAQAAVAQNQALLAQNEKVTAQLSATQTQLSALAAKVDALAPADEDKPSAAVPSSRSSVGSRGAATSSRTTAGGQGSGAIHNHNAHDPRFEKLQSQVDEQGKQIDATRSDLASTRTELTGSIAKNHDELVSLEKKGLRRYWEFDLTKSKEFKREGPLTMSLRKANTKKSYADLALVVDDRTMQQKHVNLFQPAMFYQADSTQPTEIVINDISKNHIHGYVSAPKYRKSEVGPLTVDAEDNPTPNQASNNGDRQPARQKLPTPSSDSADLE